MTDGCISALPIHSLGANPAARNTEALLRAASAPSSRANRAARALNGAVTAWFSVAVLGQLLFAVYVVGFYGRSAALGQMEVWKKVIPHGYVPGETFRNLVVYSHLTFAVLVMLAGALQLIPAVRRHAPRFHRWNGRAYLSAAVILSVGGLIMLWTHSADGSLSQHLGISLNALVIIVCAAMALHHARSRRIDVHRRWALRLFLAVSGVWFFRIGLMLWIVLNRGPVGFDPETFKGPFLTFLSFAQYLVPLAVLELYLRARDTGGAPSRVAMAVGLCVLTLLTAGGVAAATMILWLPKL